MLIIRFFSCVTCDGPALTFDNSATVRRSENPHEPGLGGFRFALRQNVLSHGAKGATAPAPVTLTALAAVSFPGPRTAAPLRPHLFGPILLLAGVG
jgi:hypothetical protein